MKCLILHCKEFIYKLDHPTPVADREVQDTEKDFKDALVAFLAVEKADSEEKSVAAAKEISRLAKLTKVQKIVINPFAHLSSSLAPADKAKNLSLLLVSNLKSISDSEVIYTSFGWYKSFIVDVLGHENSQLFREF